MMKIRNHLWKKAKKTKDEHVWIEFRRVRNFVTSEMRHCKREYLEGVIHQAKKHPRKLWLEVNRLLGRQVQPHIQLLQTEDGKISDSQDTAEALNSFFIYHTQAMAANTSPRLARKDSAVPVQFTFKLVEERTVVELLSNVNMRKAMGCDGISARALKLAGTTLAPSLCGLFNQELHWLHPSVVCSTRNYTGSIPLWSVQPGTTLAPSLCGVFNQELHWLHSTRNYTGSIPLWCVQPGTTLAPSLCGLFNQELHWLHPSVVCSTRNYTGSIPLWSVQPGTTLAPSLCGLFNQELHWLHPSVVCSTRVLHLLPYLGNGKVPM